MEGVDTTHPQILPSHKQEKHAQLGTHRSEGNSVICEVVTPILIEKPDEKRPVSVPCPMVIQSNSLWAMTKPSKNLVKHKHFTLLKILEECTTDPHNQDEHFMPARTFKTMDDLDRLKIPLSFIDHVKSVTLPGRNITHEEIYVKDDPQSFRLFDLKAKPDLVHETPYGPLSGQVHKDVNECIQQFDGINMEIVPPCARAMAILGYIVDQIREFYKETQCPADEVICEAAQIALAGTSQSFEGPATRRLQDYARKLLLKAELVDATETVVTSGSLARIPRSFRTWVQDNAVHVTGRSCVTISAVSLNRPLPKTMAHIEIIRHYSIALDGTGAALRYPDIYIMPPAEISVEDDGRSQTF